MPTIPFDSSSWDTRIAELHAIGHNSCWLDADHDKWRAACRGRALAFVGAMSKMPLPFLQGLLIVTVLRGRWPRTSTGESLVYVTEWYTAADTACWQGAFDECNTPKNRRVLFTILKAMVEAPRTWARSAMVRHLRGTGKQTQTKYHGNGVFGTGNAGSWTADDITGVMTILMDTYGGYEDIDRLRPASVLCIDTEGFESGYPDWKAWEAAEKAWEEGRDVNAFAITQTKRNTALLKLLCNTLEHMGLGPELVRPGPKAPPKARKAKVFKKGDTVTKANARDLPVGAYLVRGPKSATWRSTHLDKLVYLGRQQSASYSGSFVCWEHITRTAPNRVTYGWEKRVWGRTTEDMIGWVYQETLDPAILNDPKALP